jgi:quercetin dioxygenase-like cupin family protein
MVSAQQLAVDTEGGQRKSIGSETYSVLVSAAETDGRYTLFQWITAPGSVAGPHIHADAEESFLILDGELEFTLGQEQITARSGTWVRVPAGTRHAYRNTSAQPVRMLVLFTPGGHEELFALYTAYQEAGAGTIDEGTLGEFIRVARDVHGTTYEQFG